MVQYYKVVTQDMKSLGLKRNPNIVTYKVGEWYIHGSPVIGESDDGGYWACTTIGSARELARYVKNKYDMETRVFIIEGAGVLYKSRRRVKLKGLRLQSEIT